ncbi:hypothetical protein LTR37_020460 [Vermiconidia calcicola]|uniref:Uncharacterized protein n=1 Tax=Vermiconidia calcicola TaxID=1690605 RepID=A0ACC3MEB8_9PEZI|nr:hypothetical protein LTR37_020460 [Vermiconidia calcicola]
MNDSIPSEVGNPAAAEDPFPNVNDGVPSDSGGPGAVQQTSQSLNDYDHSDSVNTGAEEEVSHRPGSPSQDQPGDDDSINDQFEEILQSSKLGQ